MQKEWGDLPVGFSMALMKNKQAMERFSTLSENEQQIVLEGTKNVHSKEEMLSYIKKTLE